MPADCPYVSRGGLKLAAALDHFKLDVAGMVCADLGCNVGGFTDCLLQRGAAKVLAIDTGYGALAWKLRNDPRVVVLERTNALHIEPEAVFASAGLAVGPVDLAVIDLAWTPQRHAIPAALRWQPGRIITLIKPHYEQSSQGQGRTQTQPHGRSTSTTTSTSGGGGGGGVLGEAEAEAVLANVLAAMPGLGVGVIDHLRSPIRGGKGKGRAGNVEYLALLQPRG